MDWPNELGTLILTARNPTESGDAIRCAASILRAGGLVAFPTETVYGLGADALNAKAVAGIFAAKGRPVDNPLIVHIAEASQMESLAQNIPPEAYLLADKFWPGPLTLVLESRPAVPPETTGGLHSVALRVPDHPAALALLKEAAVPVAAPSANLSGTPSPTSARHVLDDLAGRIDAVLDGGPSGVGVESTVLDIRNGQPLLLRPGGVTPEEIAFILGRECPQAYWQENMSEPPPSPGLKYGHYAPKAPLYLVRGQPGAVLDRVRELRDYFQTRGDKVGLLLSRESAGDIVSEYVEILGDRKDAGELAANLYAALRRFDQQNVDVIIAEGYGEEGMGLALMNRLIKAAGSRVIDVE
ncbi:MAG: threonylcarbamoyl-AMP synthase [Clostridiales bacterium]|nr:threonylcarbamoyl-AMP synthase [Clostridiales bacterium]